MQHPLPFFSSHVTADHKVGPTLHTPMPSVSTAETVGQLHNAVPLESLHITHLNVLSDQEFRSCVTGSNTEPAESTFKQPT